MHLQNKHQKQNIKNKHMPNHYILFIFKFKCKKKKKNKQQLATQKENGGR
jgi:hypothetical protein